MSWFAATYLACMGGCVLPSARVVSATDTCPHGFATDDVRAERVVAWLRAGGARDAAGLAYDACFGPSASRGVLVAGRAWLDAKEPDAALAARLAHLAMHVRDGLGDGCAAGLTAALTSEARATNREDELRAAFALPRDGQGRDGARADYAARCAR